MVPRWPGLNSPIQDAVAPSMEASVDLPLGTDLDAYIQLSVPEQQLPLLLDCTRYYGYRPGRLEFAVAVADMNSNYGTLCPD